MSKLLSVKFKVVVMVDLDRQTYRQTDRQRSRGRERVRERETDSHTDRGLSGWLKTI